MYIEQSLSRTKGIEFHNIFVPSSLEFALQWHHLTKLDAEVDTATNKNVCQDFEFVPLIS